MALPIVPNDPRIALMWNRTDPLKPSSIDSVYEPILLPDGTDSIPVSEDLSRAILDPAWPTAPQMASVQSVAFPVLPVSSPAPLPYGQRLPAPSLPTGPSPVVPSISQPIVQNLTAPRYVSEAKVQGPVELPSYPVQLPTGVSVYGREQPVQLPTGVSVYGREQPVQLPTGVSVYGREQPVQLPTGVSVYGRSQLPGVSIVSPLPGPATNPTAPAADLASIPVRGMLPWDPDSATPSTPTRNPSAWYQSVPAAPGAPSVFSPAAPPSDADEYIPMQMDDGSIAYVPTSNAPIGNRVRVNAPSTGEDNRYTQARAPDGSIINVPTGVDLPSGVTTIPGVTNLDPNLNNDFVLTPVPAPASSGFPGWLLPVAGIGLALFFLLKKDKKEEGK